MFRYSLRFLFGLTLFVAIIAGAMFGLPPLVGILTMIAIHIMYFGALVAGAFLSRAFPRAFCLGSLWAILPAQIYITWLLLARAFDEFTPDEDFSDARVALRYMLMIELAISLLGGFGGTIAWFLFIRPSVESGVPSSTDA